MQVDARRVLDRRRAAQRELVGRAERFAGALGPELGVSAVVVFGSVARGDFNLWSDVDVLVVVASAGDDVVDRVRSAGRDIGLIAPVVWTPAQLRAQLHRRDPIAVESTERGLWLVGAAAPLLDGGP
jgi:predicted nucleotidyltransferase